MSSLNGLCIGVSLEAKDRLIDYLYSDFLVVFENCSSLSWRSFLVMAKYCHLVAKRRIAAGLWREHKESHCLI